jgi:hypothetical protein
MNQRKACASSAHAFTKRIGSAISLLTIEDAVDFDERALVAEEDAVILRAEAE